MIRPTWIVGVRKRIVGQFRFKFVDVIDLITSVLDKKTPTLKIYSQMVKGSISHGGGELELTAFTFKGSNL